MKIKRFVLRFIIIYASMVIASNLNINGILRFIIIFIGMMTGMFWVDRFLPKKADRKAEK